MMKWFTDITVAINGVVWGIPMMVLLMGTGIFLTIITKGLQFRKFGFTMKNTLGKVFTKTKVKKGELSPRQALTTALAATVGTGNIAGVTGAIGLGGPGAIFWMWIAAIFGMATKFSEIALAVRYREKTSNGEWVGGPMYYIKNGLGIKWKWLGVVFSSFAALAAFGIGNMTQINTIVTSIGSIFKAFNPSITDTGITMVYGSIGLIVAIMATMVLVGGMNSIGAVTEKLVPSMAVVYIVATMYVIFYNREMLGTVFAQIFEGAFNPMAIGGGLAGVSIKRVIQNGMGRGVFSNEAGLGSAPIAHAAAKTDHPVRQGVFGIFEVFFDTIIVCTLTSLAVLTSGCAEQFYGKTVGTELTTMAFGTAMGNKAASILVAICISMFAFSTILSWALYGIRSAEFVFGSKIIRPYTYIFIGVIVFGALAKVKLVWRIADNLNALMAIPNLIAILLLSPQIVYMIKDFFSGEFKIDTSKEYRLPQK